MAKLPSNIVTNGLSGRVGNTIYRQRKCGTVAYRSPKPYPQKTPCQKGRQTIFKKASILGKIALADNQKKQFFSAFRKDNQTIYNAAVSYYMTNADMRDREFELLTEANESRKKYQHFHTDSWISKRSRNAYSPSNPQKSCRQPYSDFFRETYQKHPAMIQIKMILTEFRESFPGHTYFGVSQNHGSRNWSGKQELGSPVGGVDMIKAGQFIIV